MCDPATIAMTLALTGTAYEGYSAYTEQRYAAGVADNNAALSREQAADAIDRGERDQQAKWRQIAQTKASQIAQMAAAGIDTTFGTGLDVIGDTAVGGMEDVSIIAQNAARETRGFHIQAQNFNNEAGAQRRASVGTVIKTGLKMGSTILGGAEQLPMFAPKKTPALNPGMAGFSAWGAPYIRTK